MKHLFLIAVCFLVYSVAHSQDKIYPRHGKVIDAKVIEVSSDEIKYTRKGQETPVYVLGKNKIDYIEFADGHTEKFYSDFKDPDNYEGQLKKAIKINFLAPLAGYTQIGFEKSISPLVAYELGFGIIGAGKNEQIGDYYINGEYIPYKRNAFGGFISAGYKFNKLPDYVSKGTRLRHLMQGTYVEPLVLIGYYKDDALNFKNGNNTLLRRGNFFASLLLNLGHQWVFGEKFLVDIYGGIGYAVDNRSDEDFYFTGHNHFPLLKAGEGTSVGLDGGIRIGLLIK